MTKLCTESFLPRRFKVTPTVPLCSEGFVGEKWDMKLGERREEKKAKWNGELWT